MKKSQAQHSKSRNGVNFEYQWALIMNHKRFARMVDLTPLDRLTRKRNMQLQKQLDVRLQIMQEEYRMTKKDLDKNSKEISEFLMSLRHTAPGLGSYGQPDTKAMNAKNIMLERRYHEENEGEEIAKDNNDRGLQRQGKAGTGRKTDKGGGTRSRPVSGKSDKGGEGEDARLISTSAASSRNEFFNRRIVLDSKRRSFMQHAMEKHGGILTKSEKQEDPRFLLGGAVTHAGFLSNRDTRGEMSRRRPKTATPRSHRPENPRYGRDAYSEQEQNVRQHILNRFDVIFDPQNEKPEGKIRGHTPSATPVFIPKDDNPTEAIPFSEKENKQHESPPATSSAKYILNRRVAWSAPPKRREDPISVVAKTNNAQHQGDASRQNLSVTPRSGTAHMARAHQRPNSVTGAALQSGREMERMYLSGQQNPKNNRNRRPGTAPPNYELKQRSMAAPRQQVAGILAEIQSRRADTRAMLTKSKQLKHMVKMLAPQEQKDDSFSD